MLSLYPFSTPSKALLSAGRKWSKADHTPWLFISRGKFSLISYHVLEVESFKSDYQNKPEESEGSSKTSTYYFSSIWAAAENICTKLFLALQWLSLIQKKSHNLTGVHGEEHTLPTYCPCSLQEGQYTAAVPREHSKKHRQSRKRTLYRTGTGLTQAVRHKDHIYTWRITFEIPNRGTKDWSACALALLAGRAEAGCTSMPAWWSTKPLTRVPDHRPCAQTCGFPCVRVLRCHTGLLVRCQQEQIVLQRVASEPLLRLCRHTQTLWSSFISVFCRSVFRKSGYGSQDLPATGHKTNSPWSVFLTATFSSPTPSKHASQKKVFHL